MQEYKNAEEKITTLVITGGSSGIGREFIKQYISYNNNIDRVCNLSRSKPAGFTNFSNFIHFEADFTDSVQFAQARENLRGYLSANHTEGEIMLVNNSGFGSFGLFDETMVERDLQMVDVLVKAPIVLTGELFPLLKKFGGRVVNISSTGGYQPTPFFITYGAAKAFQTNWSTGLWRECKGSNIKVLTVCPGPTSTEFFDNSGLKEKPGGESGGGMTVESVVKGIIKAIRKNRSLVITGFANRCMAAFASCLPKTWIASIAYHAIGSQGLQSRSAEPSDGK